MSAPELPSSIKFHYSKSNLFRVIHSEGAIGGLTPNREVFLALFNERGALPKSIEFEITPEGKMGSEISREGKDGIFREMEIGVLMNASSAQKLAEFLLGQVELLKQSEPEKHDEFFNEDGVKK